MRTVFLSFAIGLVSAVISFFLSVAFLSFVLLIAAAFNHHRADMTLTFKVALPVAALAGICGLVITLLRSNAAKRA